MQTQQNNKFIPPVLTASLPEYPNVSFRLIIWATPLQDFLPASVELLVRDVPDEIRDVLSLPELLSAIAFLWNKGTGESPALIQLTTFLSKMLKSSFPDSAVEIPTELTHLARTLDVYTAV